MQKKKRTFWQEHLAQVCSPIVSFFLFCVSLIFAFFAENTKNRGFRQKKKKNTQNKNKNLVLKTGPS